MNLTPDTFYTVAQNLDGGELMKMCSVNNETRRICTSMKFNPIWTEKLMKEFNVKYQGNNAYMEYLQHAYLYRQTYWVATIFNKNDNVIVNSKIFKSNYDAAIFLANEAMKYRKRNPEVSHPKYLTYIATIAQQGSYEDMWNKYELTESDFETKPQKTENYNNYITQLKQLYNIVKSNKKTKQVENEKDFENFKEEFEIIISEENIENDDDYEGNDVWERFKDEILPSYAVKKLDKKDIDEIKISLKYILNLNIIENSEEEREREEEEEE
jgi:hypothetical protein